MSSEPELSMLWEAVDPAITLTSRFGFGDVGELALWLEDTARKGWAARAIQCRRVVLSASNLLAWLIIDGQHFVAKSSVDARRFSQLREMDALLSWLRSEGLPVTAPFATRGDRLRVDRGHLSTGLYPVIRGNLLDVSDQRQVEAAGRTLARLHQALATYPKPFGSGHPEPDEQLVHGDFRSANIIWDGARVTAVLDFDDLAYRTRAADLAQASVLLATRYHDWSPTTVAIREAFIAAYGDIAPLTALEQDDVHSAITTVLSHFNWT